MKQFFNDNSKAIRKFFMTHVVMSLLGIMVGLAILKFEGETDGISALALISSIFTVGFLCFLHYDDMYFIGAKNAISAKAEGARLDPLRGLKITLFAYSPTLLVTLVTVCLDLFVKDTDEPTVIALMVYYACQGSFLALYRVREVIGVTGYVLVMLLPSIISSVLGYFIGSKQKTLRGLLGFKVKPPYDGPIPDKKRRGFRQ